MKRILVGWCVVLLFVFGFLGESEASFFGKDQKVGTWRGNASAVESSTGDYMVFKDVACGTKTLLDLWRGGAGGYGPYLRSDEPDVLSSAAAELTINATAPTPAQALLKLQAGGVNKAVLDASGNALFTGVGRIQGAVVIGSSITPTPTPGNLYMQGAIRHDVGTVRQFEHGTAYDEYWDQGEHSLLIRASATPIVEIDFDDVYVGVRGAFGAQTLTNTKTTSGNIRFFENGSIHTEYWDATDNKWSLRVSGVPAISVDLDDGNTTVSGCLMVGTPTGTPTPGSLVVQRNASIGGDIKMAVDKGLSIPDGSTTGPFVEVLGMADWWVDTHGSRVLEDGVPFRCGILAQGTGTPRFDFPIPARMIGKSVVVDRVTGHFVGTVGSSLQDFGIYKVSADGNIDAVVYYNTPIAMTEGDVSHQFVSSSFTMSVDHQYYMEINVGVSGENGMLTIGPIICEYHLE